MYYYSHDVAGLAVVALCGLPESQPIMHTPRRQCRPQLPALVLLIMAGSLALRPHSTAPPVPAALVSQQDARQFTLPAPRRLQNPKTLWATWYWTPTFPSTQGIPLRNDRGQTLGPRLPPPDFCRAAVEGAVRVNGKIYTWSALGARPQTDCAPYWPQMPQAPYVRFERSDTPFGGGVGDYNLVPYRTIAVDETQIPIGTVLFIPAARGCLLTLPDGRQARHDGYFFAGDDGFGVYGSHIDVYIGVSSHCPFPWVKSRPSDTFPAYIVTDPTIIRTLRRRHLPPA